MQGPLRPAEPVGGGGRRSALFELGGDDPDRVLGRVAGQRERETEEDRKGRLALFEARERPPGERGVELGHRHPLVTHRCCGHPEQAREPTRGEAQARAQHTRRAAGGVRTGVGPGDEQLLSGPDQVHAPVGQDVQRLGGSAGGDPRRPGALDLAAQRARRRDLPVAHPVTVAPPPDTGSDFSRAAPARAAGS
jgi:hypothetical protein